MPQAVSVSTTRSATCLSDLSRSSVPSVPRKYFCARMLVAFRLQVSGTSTPELLEGHRAVPVVGDAGVAPLPARPRRRGGRPGGEVAPDADLGSAGERWPWCWVPCVLPSGSGVCTDWCLCACRRRRSRPASPQDVVVHPPPRHEMLWSLHHCSYAVVNERPPASVQVTGRSRKFPLTSGTPGPGRRRVPATG